MADKRITIEGTEPLLLFGFNDVFLRRVEAAFPKTQITARGNQVLLRGEEEMIAQVERVLNELILILNRNGNLTENDVDTVLTLFTLGDGAGGGYPGHDTRDVVLFTPSGGVIKAKTPNQARLVEAARNHDIVFAIGPAGTGKTYTAVALAVSAMCERLAADSKTIDPDRAALAGLLHDAGKLAVAIDDPGAFAQAVDRAERTARPLAHALRAVVGIDHHTAGKRLAEAWGLPGPVRDGPITAEAAVFVSQMIAPLLLMMSPTHTSRSWTRS